MSENAVLVLIIPFQTNVRVTLLFDWRIVLHSFVNIVSLLHLVVFFPIHVHRASATLDEEDRCENLFHFPCSREIKSDHVDATG